MQIDSLPIFVFISVVLICFLFDRPHKIWRRVKDGQVFSGLTEMDLERKVYGLWSQSVCICVYVCAMCISNSFFMRVCPNATKFQVFFFVFQYSFLFTDYFCHFVSSYLLRAHTHALFSLQLY